jgi:tRNA G18 (ribose-2'-O)-methylase SpoU
VNLGVALRSAEAAGLEALYLVGDRATSLSSARGAELAIPLHVVPDAAALLLRARAAGYQVVAVQQTPQSEPYHLASYPPRPLFVLGAEDTGLPDALRAAADLAVEIPLYGLIDSLNVASAATCVVMHWRAHASPEPSL